MFMLHEIDGVTISVSLMAGRLVTKMLIVKRRVTGERRCPAIFESHIHVLIRTDPMNGIPALQSISV